MNMSVSNKGSNNKMKLLVVGNGSLKVLEGKLNQLQSSKAGPFDVCICVGSMDVDRGSDESSICMPLPVYIVHPVGCAEEDENEISLEDETETETEKKKTMSNIVYLSSVVPDIVDIECGDGRVGMRVAYVPKGSVCSNVSVNWKNKVESGVDVLVSHDWGQGMSAAPHCFPSQSLAFASASSEDGSYDVAVLANQCQPRYHFTSSYDQSCYTSLPFANIHISTTAAAAHLHPTTRFLALAPLVPGKVPKSQKCVHALNLQPLSRISDPSASASAELSSSSSAIPSPYTTVLFPPPPPTTTTTSTPAQTPSFANPTLTAASSSYSYFGTGKRAREEEDASRNMSMSRNTENVDSNNTSLFLHGLHKDVTGRLSRDSKLIHQTFQPFGCVNVRIPTSKRNQYATYCFLDFHTHQQAKLCLQQLQTNLVIHQVPLFLKWSTSKKSHQQPQHSHQQHNQQQQPNKKARLTEQDAKDSSCLFLRVPKSNQCTEHLQWVQRAAQTSLEDAMNEPEQGNDNDNDQPKITADTEPALKVTLRLVHHSTNKHDNQDAHDHPQQQQEEEKVSKNNYGFLDFASHAAANMAIATLTGDINGGSLLKLPSDQHPNTPDWQLFWAKPPTPTSNHSQQHNTTTTTTSCWFCLASPTCDQKLIVRVQTDIYIAMARGPMHDYHCILIPIAHDSETPTTSGIFHPSYSITTNNNNTNTAKEILDTIHQLVHGIYASPKSNIFGVFVFERAIPTKRGVLHSHVQCIPLSTQNAADTIIDTFLQMAKQSSMEFKELTIPSTTTNHHDHNNNKDEKIEATLSTLHQQFTSNDDNDHDHDNDDGNENTLPPLLGYFYAQVILYSKPPNDNGTNHHNDDVVDDGGVGNPTSKNTTTRHFLYKHENESTVKVPLQFGREVVAAVMNQHELSDWKNCISSPKEEEEKTNQFRQLLVSSSPSPSSSSTTTKKEEE